MSAPPRAKPAMGRLAEGSRSARATTHTVAGSPKATPSRGRMRVAMPSAAPPRPDQSAGDGARIPRTSAAVPRRMNASVGTWLIQEAAEAAHQGERPKRAAVASAVPDDSPLSSRIRWRATTAAAPDSGAISQGRPTSMPRASRAAHPGGNWEKVRPSCSITRADEKKRGSAATGALRCPSAKTRAWNAWVSASVWRGRPSKRAKEMAPYANAATRKRTAGAVLLRRAGGAGTGRYFLPLAATLSALRPRSRTAPHERAERTAMPTAHSAYMGQWGGGRLVPGSPGIQSATGRRESRATSPTAPRNARVERTLRGEEPPSTIGAQLCGVGDRTRRRGASGPGNDNPPPRMGTPRRNGASGSRQGPRGPGVYSDVQIRHPVKRRNAGPGIPGRQRLSRTGMRNTFFTAFILVLGLATPLAGQVHIVGRVIDDTTARPLEGAQVTVRAADGRFLGRVETEATGTFEFTVQYVSSVRIDIRRMSYEANAMPLLHFDGRKYFQVEARLAPDAILLAPLEVIAWSEVDPSPFLEGFRQRLRGGMGLYITREQIDARRPTYVSDLLREVPGVTVTGSGTGNRPPIQVGRSMSSNSCQTQIFVDGFLLNWRTAGLGGGPSNDFRLDDA
ncbi:MAG: hypothetical protein FIA95_12750, partial [Gemmatimonadetes bacterium]|nr:hypothetical protein [Gemmatimonadota bacterium]